jgi:hypothetical protein
LRSFYFFKLELGSNYFLAGASVAGAAVVSAGAAVVSAGAAVVSAGAAVVSATAVVSAVPSAAFSDCLQDTTVNAAITAKLKNTFFILLNYKRLIINSEQRYKFF